MNRKTILGVVVAVGLFAGGVFAQDYIYAFKGAFEEVVVKSPCATRYGGQRTIAVSGPNVYDGSAWITYVCENSEVILRRYHNPNDSGQKPIPVFTVADPSTLSSPTPTATKTVACTVPGMVTSIYGGCVPPDHPNAPRGVR